MPERFFNMAPSSGHASPGPQVIQPSTDRPIPTARRRAVHGASGVDSSGGDGGHQGSLYVRDQPSFVSTAVGREDHLQITEAERRRQFLTSSTLTSVYPTSRPVSTVRPQSALAVTSPAVHPVERPPSSLGVAWGHKYGPNRPQVDPRYTNHDMTRTAGNVESKIKALGVDQNLGRRNGQAGHRPMEDGELIPPFHQRSRSHGDGVTSSPGYQGDHIGFDRPEDAYAMGSRSSDVSRGHHILPGYMGSQPHEQRTRQDVYNPAAGFSPKPTVASTQDRPIARGQPVAPGFGPGDRQWNRPPANKTPVPQSQDLRSAWQRLYGNRPEPQAANRRPSVEEIIRAQTPQHNARGPSPHHHGQSNPPRPSQVVGNDSTDSVLGYHDAGHSAVHHYTQPSNALLLSGRESPTGQSSSNPEQLSNNSSQLSNYSTTNTNNKTAPSPQRNLSTFKPKIDTSGSSSNSHLSPVDPTIGPAAKYPTTQSTQRGNSPGQYSSSERIPYHNERSAPDDTRPGPNRHTVNDFLYQDRSRIDSISPETVEFVVSDSASLRPPSRHKSHALFDSGDEMDGNGSDYPALNPVDSMFDYPGVDSDNGSVTPPLPPLSPNATPRGSGHATPTNISPRYLNTSRDHLQKSPPKTPDLMRAHAALSSSRPRGSKKDVRRPGQAVGKDRPSRPDVPGAHRGDAKTPGNPYVRSRSLDDVRESDNESTLSFDVENTLLTVEPSDQSEMGTLRSSHKSTGSVRAQLSRLEGMYSHVMKTLEENTTQQAPRTRRRWSIGSSDTSSFHQHSHSGKHGGHSGRTSAGKLSSRDVRSIGKRFQRLESHVITLARSVAHLSSELRTHTSVSREIELVKREMAELKSQGAARPLAAPRNPMGGNILMTDYERYRGWVPSLTNPRRVNKLTKFFGQEPPLLEIFLKRLGYERYAKNFEEEHIGMIELPYMTEERLQAIGIPMGPRLRILQEAQLCFKQGNFDVYFV